MNSTDEAEASSSNGQTHDIGGGNSEKQQDKPWVYLIHRKPQKGHMVRGFNSPPGGPLLRTAGAPDKFQIVPLGDGNAGNGVRSAVPIPTTKTAYLEELRSSLEYRVVAILNDAGQYLSCRTICPLTGGALAEYRSEIGEYEKFRLTHHHSTGTYSFQSHNGLFLHYNSVLGTIAFKVKHAKCDDAINLSESSDTSADEKKNNATARSPPSGVDTVKTSWHVVPLGLLASDSERILHTAVFGLGVKSTEPDGSIGLKSLIERTAEGEVRHDWEAEPLSAYLKTLANRLGPGQCTIFLYHDGSTEDDSNNNINKRVDNHSHAQYLWAVTKDEYNLTMNVVVASAGYPHALAAECVEDLADAYELIQGLELQKGFDQSKVDRIAGTRLAAIMYDHDDAYMASIHCHCAAVQKIQEEMRGIIEMLHGNILKEKEILEMSKELEENAKQFKKLTEQARPMPSALYFIGGAAGHVGISLLVGDVTLIFDVIVPLLTWAGVYKGAQLVTRFWKRPFVSFSRR